MQFFEHVIVAFIFIKLLHLMYMSIVWVYTKYSKYLLLLQKDISYMTNLLIQYCIQIYILDIILKSYRESGKLIILRLFYIYAYIFQDKNQTTFDLSEIRRSFWISFDINRT